MSDQENNEPPPGAPIEIRINPDESLDWNEALKELENYRPPSKPKAAPAANVPASNAPPPAAAKPAPAPKPTPQPVMVTPLPTPVTPTPTPVESDRPELVQDRGDRIPPLDGDISTDLATIMTAVNSAMQQLRKFEQAHPYLVAPNIFRTWEEELKETSILMSREYHRLRDEPATRGGSGAED